MARAERLDVVILGAGAAGMFCAAKAAATGGRVLAIDHAAKPGEKIRISGGGRCNFTNLDARAEAYLSENPHFAKSALARFTPQDFLALIRAHRIPFHEKTLGQLFCDRSAQDVIEMLLAEMTAAGARLSLRTEAVAVAKTEDGFRLTLAQEGARREVETRRLVLATGGKSIPKMGASAQGYRLAEQFGLGVTETRPGLAPLTFSDAAAERLKALSGVAAPVIASAARGPGFAEAALFTHRGLSGPAILQISSYWREGERIALRLAPGVDWAAALRAAKVSEGRRGLAAALAAHLPKRLAQERAEALLSETAPLAAVSDKALEAVAAGLTRWELTPTGSEGYRTAEVTLGGVDTRGLDGRSLAARDVPGLYVIGELVDVTGWLGGYNFQWAWSSGHAAGTAIAAAIAEGG